MKPNLIRLHRIRKQNKIFAVGIVCGRVYTFVCFAYFVLCNDERRCRSINAQQINDKWFPAPVYALSSENILFQCLARENCY